MKPCPLSLLIVILCANAALAVERYLDITATGSANGTSRVNAWTNPTNITGLLDGDLLWVYPGTYAGKLEILNIPNLTIRIDQGSTNPAVFPFMQFSNCDDSLVDGLVGTNQLFWVTGDHPTLFHSVNWRLSSNFICRGVSIDRSAWYSADTNQQHGIRVWNECGKFVIEQCSVANTSGDGINVTQIDYTGSASFKYDWIMIRDCTLTRLGDDGVQLGSNRRATMRNCIVRQLGFETFFSAHPDGVQLNPDGGNLMVDGNFFEDNTQNIFTEWCSSNIVIINNVVRNTHTNGAYMGVACSIREPFTGDFILANNVFVDFFGYGAISASYPTNRTNTRVSNNVFIDCKRGMISTNYTSYIETNNLWYDTPGVLWYDTDGNIVPAVVPRNFGTAQNLNPMMTADYRTILGSPARNAGLDLSAWFVTDKSGDTRTVPWDIGPYEFNPVIRRINVKTLRIK